MSSSCLTCGATSTYKNRWHSGLCRRCYRRKHYYENLSEQRRKRREYYYANRERFLSSYCAEKRRAAALKRNYNITPLQFEEMREAQNGRCKLCKLEPSETIPGNHRSKTLHIDHDHLTGRVRGLLCGLCNKGLGVFKDNISTLEAAVQYLQDSRYDEDFCDI